MGKIDVKITNDASCSYLPGNLGYVARFRKTNTKTQVTIIPGYVAWFYALGHYKIMIMVIIIMDELSVITIILIIILDNILPTYAIHHF